MIARLLRGQLVNPLKMVESKQVPRGPTRVRLQLDSVERDFIVEVLTHSSARSIREAADTARRLCPEGEFLLVLCPFVSEDLARELYASGISVVDLCGNLLVTVPGTWYMERLGKPNRFPDTRLVKNVYRGASSLVPRALTDGTSYPSASALLEAIAARGGQTSLPTVSRVLRQLEQEAVVVRVPAIRVVDCERLLRLFVQGYAPPSLRRRISRRVENLSTTRLAMVESAKAASERLVCYTPERYVDLPASYEELTVYTTSADAALAGLELKSDAPFRNLTVLETDDPSVYFDTIEEQSLPWLSPLEAYLQLATGDDRMRRMSTSLREQLIRRCSNGD